MVETWLDDSYTDNELGLFNYSLFRCDRPQGVLGGGVLVGVRKDLMCSQIITPTFLDFQSLFVEVKIGNDNLIIGAIYIPPSSPITCYDNTQEILETLTHNFENHKLLLTGDFNLPRIYWVNEVDEPLFFTDNLTINSVANAAQSLADFTSFMNLTQYNRITNHNGYSLDLIFSSFFVKIDKESDVFIAPIDVHHPPLTFPLPLEFSSISTTSKVFFNDYNNADYDAINYFFDSVNWDLLLNNLHINDAVEIFAEISRASIDFFVPIKSYKVDSYPSWFDQTLKNMICEKKKAHLLYKKTGARSYYVEFSKLRSAVKNYSDSLLKNYIHEVENSVRSNVKYF